MCSYWPAVSAPWSFRALETYWNVGAWQNIASTSESLLDFKATGPNINDRTHIDPAPATLLFSEDFLGTSLDTARWEVDHYPVARINRANSIVSDGALRLTIANSSGARVYWGGWKANPPPIARYGRYEFRMKITVTPGAGT